VREHGYDGMLWHIPHPAWPPPLIEPARIEGAPLIGCFGHLNESKRIPQLLRAFAEFRASHPGARLLLVGAEAPGFDLEGRLERLGLDDTGVVREPYVEEERLWALMSACDAVVQLRAPTMGETSGSAIRTLALGKPLVVSDVGWFAELPDDVALKVPVGGDEEVAATARALERLAEPGVAARMGEAARAFVRAEHDLDRVAGQYVAALEQAAGRGGGRGEDRARGRGGRGRHGRRAGGSSRRASRSSASSARTATSRYQIPGRVRCGHCPCGLGSRRSTSPPSSSS